MLRTILFPVPAWNCTPSPLTPKITESLISRPAAPVTETAGPLPVGNVTASF